MTSRPVLGPDEERFLTRHPLGHLATVDRRARPQLVPVCFVAFENNLYVALDQKPKSVDALRLKRVRNIQENPEVSFLVDDYDDNWEKLAYLQIHGRADIRDPGATEHLEVIARLRAKYPQYQLMPLEQHPYIRIVPTAARGWSWHGWPPKQS